MTVTSDLTGPLSAIGQVAAAADEMIAGLAAQNEQLQQENADLTGQLATANQQIAALEANQKPPLLVGAAATSAASFNGLGVTLLRQYHGPDTIPASFKSTYAGAKQWVVSIKPQLDGSQAAAVSTWAKTVPAGARVVIQHEPENKSKSISPAQFASCWEAYAPLIRQANPAVTVGQCFMAFTSNGRPVDAVHKAAGQNEWLTAGCSRTVKPDFVLWDGYVYGPNYATPAATFDGPRRLADALIPGIEQGIAEVGATGSGTTRAGWFTTLGQYARQVGFTVLCLFDEGANLIDNDPPTLGAFKALAAP